MDFELKKYTHVLIVWELLESEGLDFFAHEYGIEEQEVHFQETLP